MINKVFWLTVLIGGLITALPGDEVTAKTIDTADAAAAATEAELHASTANGDYEPTVLAIIERIERGQLEQALESAESHLALFPKSRVGHFLRADIIQAMAGQLTDVGSSARIPATTLAGLKHQIRNRWKHARRHQAKSHHRYPASLLDMGRHQHVLVADLAEGRLYLYRNQSGQPELLRDYYMSVGSAGFGKEIEGDNKTPVGVYEVIKHIEGKRLPDLYGKGAFPVNYPNRYDRYKKRTGYGIWLHGTPSDTYARSPWSSEGCFVLSNDDLLDIGNYVSVKNRTPVILSDRIEWLDAAQLAARKQEKMALIERWKRDWESLDTEASIAHYARDGFNFGKGDYTQWVQRKRRVNRGKTFVQLDLVVDSLFAYPGVEDMFVVTFQQRYQSNNYSSSTQKEQYWRRDSDGQWRIIFEGSG